MSEYSIYNHTLMLIKLSNLITQCMTHVLVIISFPNLGRSYYRLSCTDCSFCLLRIRRWCMDQRSSSSHLCWLLQNVFLWICSKGLQQLVEQTRLSSLGKSNFASCHLVLMFLDREDMWALNTAAGCTFSSTLYVAQIMAVVLYWASLSNLLYWHGHG